MAAPKGTKKRRCETCKGKGKVKGQWPGQPVDCTACQGRGGIDLTEV